MKRKPEGRTSTDAYTAAERSHWVTTEVVYIDQNMQVSVAVMGRRVSLDAFHFRDDIATIEDVETFLQSLHEMPVCGGGPKTSVFPLAHPESASVDECNPWRHKKCTLLVCGNNIPCKWRSSLTHSGFVRRGRPTKEMEPNRPSVSVSHPFQMVTECLLSVEQGMR